MLKQREIFGIYIMFFKSSFGTNLFGHLTPPSLPLQVVRAILPGPSVVVFTKVEHLHGGGTGHLGLAWTPQVSLALKPSLVTFTDLESFWDTLGLD